MASWAEWGLLLSVAVCVCVCVCVCVPGDAGQVSDDVEEVVLGHFTEAWVLWEGDDGGAIFPSPSCDTQTHNI